MTDKTWRPPGWQNPWPKGKYLNEDECRRLAEAYEAGAEAVLKAMKASVARLQGRVKRA